MRDSKGGWCGAQVNHFHHPLPCDDAQLWSGAVHRTRVAPRAPSSNVIFPGRPLGAADDAGGVHSDALPCVRFAGSTDPSASWRTTDPYLAGAGYQRLLRTEDSFARATGARRSLLREHAAGPRSS